MFKIVLDPGHGENENVGICNGYREGNRMFVLAYLLKTQLERYQDVEVTVTRAKLSDNPELAQRGEWIPAETNLFMSLHSNATGSADVNGTEIYDTVSPAHRSEMLAQRLGIGISALMGSPFRGVQHRYNDDNVTDYYGVLRAAIRIGAYAAMLVEHGFHTNMTDCQYLSSDANLAQLALAEAAILAVYYGWLPVAVPEPIQKIIYRVQVGAFKVLTNAEELKRKIMERLGIDAFITPIEADGFYHVQAGAYSVSNNADRQVEKLKAAGFSAIIKKGY